MRVVLWVALVAVLLLIAAFATGLLGVDQTRDGQLPTIKAQGGQLPGFEVKHGDVQVGTTNKTVDVPTMGTEAQNVAVPKVQINKAR